MSREGDEAMDRAMEIRRMQLVAREAVIGSLMGAMDNEGEEGVIRLIYEETLAEMESLGLEPYEESDWDFDL